MSEPKQIVRQPLAQAAVAAAVQHPLNPQARRRTVSLGDATGLTAVGVHLNVVAPGDTSTELHRHACADEFVYIVRGRGVVTLDAHSYEVGEGDFIGFPRNGPAHAMTNTGEEDLVYLVGGNRQEFDACDYPRLGKRLYLVPREDGRSREVVGLDHVTALG